MGIILCGRFEFFNLVRSGPLWITFILVNQFATLYDVHGYFNCFQRLQV